MPANNTAVQATTVSNACPVPEFSSPTNLPTVGGDVFGLIAADFNGDGTKDVISSTQGGHNVTVRFNDGQGHFNTSLSNSGGAQVRGIAIADFNGDGHPDIAALRTTGSFGDLLILRGDGAGNFTGVTSNRYLSAGINVFAIAVGDFNEDGRPDVAAGAIGGNGPIVSLNDGAGNFPSRTIAPTGTSPLTLLVADVNEDGHADLIVGHRDMSYFSVLLGHGNGTFDPALNITTGAGPRVRAIGDLNRDGHLDLVVVDRGTGGTARLTTLLGNGHGGFGPQLVLRTSTGVGTATIADINGDGFADVVSTDFASSAFYVQFGDGNGNFGAPLGYGGPIFSNVVVDDFNGDGRPDVAIGDGNGVIRVYPEQLRPGVEQRVDYGVRLARSGRAGRHRHLYGDGEEPRGHHGHRRDGHRDAAVERDPPAVDSGRGRHADHQRQRRHVDAAADRTGRTPSPSCIAPRRRRAAR